MRWDSSARDEVFLFSVSAPQYSGLNRSTWLKIERATSHAVVEGDVDEIVVFAGPIFSDGTIANYRGLIKIPSDFYRIAYNPGDNSVVAWVASNDANAGSVNNIDSLLVSIDTIEELTGLDFLSSLPESDQVRLESQAIKQDWILE